MDSNPVNTPSFTSFRDVAVQFAKLQPALVGLSQTITTIVAALEAGAAENACEGCSVLHAIYLSDGTLQPLSQEPWNTSEIPRWLASGEFAEGY